MADKKISELTAYSYPADDDVLPIVQTATPETKKISWLDFLTALLPWRGDFSFKHGVAHQIYVEDPVDADTPGDAIILRGGNGNGDAGGGSATLQGGNRGTSGPGGDVVAFPGQGDTNGHFIINDPDSGLSAVFKTEQISGASKNYEMPDADGEMALYSTYTADIVLLTALPSTFTTLHFVKGILVGVD